MNQPPLLTDDEFHNVKMTMILPIKLDVLQQDMKKMNQLKLRLDVHGTWVPFIDIVDCK